MVNIACGERTTLNQVIELINQFLGTDIEPECQDPRPGDVRHSLASIDTARRVIRCEPRVFFAEGLERSIERYKQSSG